MATESGIDLRIGSSHDGRLVCPETLTRTPSDYAKRFGMGCL